MNSLCLRAELSAQGILSSTNLGGIMAGVTGVGGAGTTTGSLPALGSGGSGGSGGAAGGGLGQQLQGRNSALDTMQSIEQALPELSSHQHQR